MVSMTSILRKCETAAGFLIWSNLREVLTQNLKNDRWEPESEWEANGNWYKWIFFFFCAGLGRLKAEIGAGELIFMLLQHSMRNYC